MSETSPKQNRAHVSTPNSPESENELKRRPIRDSKTKLYPPLSDYETDSDDESGLDAKEMKEHYTIKTKVKKGKYNVPPDLENSESSSYINYSSCFKIVKYFVILFLSFIAISVLPYQYFAPRELSSDQVVKDIRNQFKNQLSITYNCLEKELKKVVDVEHEPSAPAIFTLIANKGAENTASEFSHYLADKLAPSRYLSINDSTYWTGNQHDIKFKIDNDIKSKVKRDHLSVIIVDNIQNIPTEAVMIFHNYCDHELAQFKRVVFLFIVPSDEIIPENADFKHIDIVADKCLRKIWHTADPDLIDSLIVRITVAVINIR